MRRFWRHKWPYSQPGGFQRLHIHPYGITIVNPTVLLSSAGPDTVALF